MPSFKVKVLFKAIAATISLSSIEVTSFTVSISRTPTKRNHQSLPSIISSSSSMKRSATIIGWDDESSSYTSTFDEPDHDILGQYDNSISHGYNSIADTISQNSEKTASLARLAAAFAPPDQSIKMEDITQIQVIQVSSSHIELSAVVCDESQCVTILVPVPFQHDCTGSCSDSEYECVLNNIDDLDDQAKQLLQQKSLGSRSEERELLRSLYDNTNLKYPHWWVSPQSPDMFGESQYINILNQDTFQDQIQALAKKGLERTQDGHLFEIKRAAVCAIGSAGFYFRAIAVQKDNYDVMSTSSSSKGESPCTILEIPYRFSAHQSSMITDASSLRSAVLSAVSSIQ